MKEGGNLKYTKATQYALHLMAYMVNHEGNDKISLQPLVDFFQVSPTYLSKILTQLVKADLIQSTPGVNGGYSLRKEKECITFLDIIHAIEGTGQLFSCDNDTTECQLQKVMHEAESRMNTYLQEKTIYEAVKDLPEHSNEL